MPAPRIARPSDNTSSVAMSLAVCTGGRYPMINTVWPSFIFSVMAATNSSVPIGSSHAIEFGAGKLPSSV